MLLWIFYLNFTYWMIEKQCKSYELNIFPHKYAIRCAFRKWKLNFCNFLTDNIFRCLDLLEKRTFKLWKNMKQFLEWEEWLQASESLKNLEQKYFNLNTYHSNFEEISKIIKEIYIVKICWLSCYDFFFLCSSLNIYMLCPMWMKVTN